MFQGWRLKLREAEDAFRQGRLEEAGQLLSVGDLRQFLPAQQLIAKVAARLAQRARDRAVRGETSAGWRDLETARALAGNTDELQAASQELLVLTLREAEGYLEAANPAGALTRLDSLERRKMEEGPLRILREVARRMESARNLSRRGKFTEAEAQLAAAAALRPDLPVIERQLRSCREKRDHSRQLSEQLHIAMG
jgi:hypothetical protein